MVLEAPGVVEPSATDLDAQKAPVWWVAGGVDGGQGQGAHILGH